MTGKKSSKRSVSQQWYRRNPVFIFIFFFTLQIIAFYFFYLNPWVQENIINHLLNLYAVISSWLLNLAGQKTSVLGYIIYSNHFSVEIKKGCDAIEPMALFCAGVLAFPATSGKKAAGLFTGLLILFFLNILRIVVLFLTGVYNRSLFEAMHIEIWQIIFILIAMAIWFLWIRWSVRKSTGNG